MPGPFTHIYTARRVAEFLSSNTFVRRNDGPLLSQQALDPNILGQFGGADFCSMVMERWEKYAALGAIGPDLFFFCQDYSKNFIPCDEIMLAMSAIYMVDDSQRDDWEPLLAILDGVSHTWADILRFLIKLDKIWQKFLTVWNETVGQVVSAIGQVVDDMTGGMLSTLGDAITELANDLIGLLAEGLLTQVDIFSWFSLGMRKGFDEQAFLWSDMLHYRRTSKMAANLVNEARKLLASGDPNPQTNTQYQQFMAYALGWMCHIGTDVVAHSFVNEQSGGPFRTHWQRHHLVENHLDGWNYHETKGSPSPLPPDPFCAATDAFPSLNQSALYFAVQLTPSQPNGDLRPTSLPPDDSAHADARKAALDTDGEMPDWLSEGIVQALIDTYASDPPQERPGILMGSAFQDIIKNDPVKVAAIVENLTGAPLDRPVSQLLDLIAPSSNINVPRGFPLPWEVKVSYRFMLSFFKRSFMDSLNLQKPQAPTIFTPPPSDFQFPGPPDFGGPGSSDNPVSNFWDWLAALFNWLAKVLQQAAQAAYDIAKMIASGATYPLRDLIYQTVILPAWTGVEGVREILCHLGFLMPQDEELYPDGEIAKPSEIDTQLVTLGHTVDSAFLTALAANSDPLGNLDLDPSLAGVGIRNPRDKAYPWLPVRDPKDPTGDPVEFERPWAFPNLNNDHSPNRIEPSPTMSGPYPVGEIPNVLLRTNGPGSNRARFDYQNAPSPVDTDKLNEQNIGHNPTDGDLAVNPLGDPIIFSAYVIGQVVGNPGWQVGAKDDRTADFNLDADRGYGYLCWDWNRDIRGLSPQIQETMTVDGVFLKFNKPCVWPEGAKFDSVNEWNFQNDPAMTIHYKKGADPGCTQSTPMQLQANARPAAGGKVTASSNTTTGAAPRRASRKRRVGK